MHNVHICWEGHKTGGRWRDWEERKIFQVLSCSDWPELHSSGSQLHTDRRREEGGVRKPLTPSLLGLDGSDCLKTTQTPHHFWPDNYCFQLFQSGVKEISKMGGKRRWAEKKGGQGIKTRKGVEEKQIVENKMKWRIQARWHARTQKDKRSVFTEVKKKEEVRKTGGESDSVVTGMSCCIRNRHGRQQPLCTTRWD